ncbi:MAG: cysteine--tRNA ligase [Spirochaetaceae bacterium]|jgi:cysteinyl-tRNA synthetase|nr:cysteine--tRNA ligase [Spirochaetaceae bacterium]
MALTLFNTLGRRLEPFRALKAGEVGFYGCGPTVYNYAHIGNLRAYVTHDLLVKTLKYLGYGVKHVMNITDVGHLSGDDDSGDDKMVKSAATRGKSVLEIAEFYTKAFFDDLDLMRIARADVIPRATEHIPDMIELIGRIEKAGFTYESGGNLYFDISRFPNYGELALLRLDELKAGARTGVDENKRNPQDFVLWFTRSKFENQALTWDSPWGRGYPGWHIECSAMSIKYLGEQFDIHAGGIDHVPIHHTNEIAQSEAATGRHPWVRYWVHNEFLVLDKGKMSKSSGSFLTLRSLIDQGYNALDYRYFLLGGHYRSQLQFSFEALDGARNARRSLLERVKALSDQAGAIPGAYLPASPEACPAASPDAGAIPGTGVVIGEEARKALDNFRAALEDDLSSPRALAELWSLVRNPRIRAEEALAAAFVMDSVFSLDLWKAALERREASTESGESVREIEALVAERAGAKKTRDFDAADRIRDELKKRGIALEDGPGGTTWKRI